jgi:hypothetical protein
MPFDQILPRHPSDLMIDDKGEARTIISHHYTELTGKPMTTADDDAASAFINTLECPLTKAAVRAGIARTLLRTKHPKIHSLKYFLSEIRTGLDGNDAFAEYSVMKAKREGKLK